MSCDMWFGTKDYAQFIRTPQTGADVSPQAWGSSGTLLNGSGYAFNSFNSHKEYQFSWGSVAAREAAQTMKSYFDGSFGRGKLYFQDPLTYDTNVLPARWADPSITADFEGPQLVPGVDPTTTPTSNFQYLKLPVRTAVFDLSTATPNKGYRFEVEAENFLTNPRFQGSGEWVEVRRNLTRNPSFDTLAQGMGVETSSMSTGGGAALALDPDWSDSGSTSLLILGSGISTSAYLWRNSAATGMTLDKWGGRTVTISATVRLTEPNGASPTNNNGARSIVVGVSIGGEMTWKYAESQVPEDVPGAYRVSVTVTLPEGGASDYWIVRLFNGSPSGVPVNWDSVLIEEFPEALPFFSGGSPDREVDPDMRQRWVGAIGVSESVMEGETVRDVVAASKNFAIVSQWDGKPALRHINHRDTTDAYILLKNSFTSPRGGTLLGTSHLKSPITGTDFRPVAAFRVGNPIQASSRPNEVGSVFQRLTFTHLSSPGWVRLNHGGLIGSPDVWWTEVALTEGEYLGPFFDGGTAIPGRITEWTGDPYASTSTVGMYAPDGTINVSEDNSVYIPIPDGMQLSLGSFYESDSPVAGVYCTASYRGAPAEDFIRLTPLTPSSQSLFPDSIVKPPGADGVYLFIGKSEPGNYTVLVTAIHARLSPIGEAPKGEHRWLGGQGNAGVRFTQPPTYINHTGVNGGQVEFAATFKESIL